MFRLFDFDLEIILLRVPAIIIALTVHEFSHGFMAYLLGDRTAKRDGRMSFNPLRHIDPIGMICLILIGFGWAKPVMVNPRNLKDPKHGMGLTAVAGPVSNFILAFIVMLVYYPLVMTVGLDRAAIGYLFTFLWILFSINIVLGIFNMLPIPPLDGSKVFAVFLPEDIYFKFISFRYGFIVLIILIFTDRLSSIIQPFMTAISNGYIFVVERIYFFI